MIPETMFAGDSFDALISGASHSASDGWVMHLRLVAVTPGNRAIDLTGTAEGGDHRLSAPASATSGWAADRYTWARWSSRGDASITLATGSMLVRPDPRTMKEGFDGRSPNRIALEDAKQAFRDWNPTRRRYRIGDREMEFNSAADILVKIRFLEHEVAREELLAGGQPKLGRRIYTRL